MADLARPEAGQGEAFACCIRLLTSGGLAMRVASIADESGDTE